MAYPPIPRRPIGSFKVRPNLENDEAADRSPAWPDVADLPKEGLNIAFECLDRHRGTNRWKRPALIWEGRGGAQERYTFEDLKNLADRISGVLASIGLRRGDRVFLFLERIPELYATVLGALQAGGVVGPLFSTLGPDALRYRLQDAGAKILVTSPALLPRLERIRHQLPDLRKILVVNREGADVTSLGQDEICLETEIAGGSNAAVQVRTSPEDPAFIHFTPAITGRPRGATHVHDAIRAIRETARGALDLHDEDVYWCTLDPGWIAGTVYGMFGPWACGVTSVVPQGRFGAEAWYRTIERHRVTVWYTTPTAIRMLRKAGTSLPGRFDLSTLRHICSAGERLDPELIVWGMSTFGVPIHESWWQTETGSIQICNLPIMEIRPGSMGRPYPGVIAAIVDEEGREMPPGEEGHLALRPGWPSMFRTYWSDPVAYEARFRGGWYYTGDRARRDADGYFWFVERADDVIRTAGHLVGPFEVESTLLEHPAVAEAGVIGKPDPVRTEIIKAFLVLKGGFGPSEALKAEIRRFVKHRLALHAFPREIQFVPSLPRTSAGRVMRRLLKGLEVGSAAPGRAAG